MDVMVESTGTNIVLPVAGLVHDEDVIKKYSWLMLLFETQQEFLASLIFSTPLWS